MVKLLARVSFREDGIMPDSEGSRTILRATDSA